MTDSQPVNFGRIERIIPRQPSQRTVGVVWRTYFLGWYAFIAGSFIYGCGEGWEAYQHSKKYNSSMTMRQRLLEFGGTTAIVTFYGAILGIVWPISAPVFMYSRFHDWKLHVEFKGKVHKPEPKKV